ncbi:restriction endonuclease [Verrucomicrobiales bacterium BCK34]|nr:restriction endonuclease [Verrucomicrobiales bacterium BCK34]
MPIPSYHELMLPVLKVLSDGEALHRRDYSKRVADLLNLSEEDQEERLPSGNETYLYNRCGWSGWYLLAAGLVQKPKRGYLQITETGKELLNTNPEFIDKSVLEKYPSYVERVVKGKGKKVKTTEKEESDKTPEERIETAYAEILESKKEELLGVLAEVDPYHFEEIVIDLLFAMGYGGSRAEAAQVTKKSGDGGIDGVINEDRLGLDVIYVQAKRWEGSVGRVEIQNFVGALAGKQAHKGVFITTSDFNKNASDYAATVPQKIILIDGEKLAGLMIEFGIGITPSHSFAIPEIDSDYFETK